MKNIIDTKKKVRLLQVLLTFTIKLYRALEIYNQLIINFFEKNTRAANLQLGIDKANKF